MLFKGFKIRVRCKDWEQVAYLDEYWDLFSFYVPKEDIIGLGMNWSDDYLYFDYVIGVINDESILNKIKNIDFSKTKFMPEYVEIQLPNIEEWQSFKGKDENLKEIYESDIKCYDNPYDYELEYIDSKGNIEIKIHYISS